MNSGHVKASRHVASVFERQIWTAAYVAADPSAYVSAVAVNINSPIDRAAFRRSVESLLHRHPVLRSVYHLEGDVLYRDEVVVPDLPTVIHDLGPVDERSLNGAASTIYESYRLWEQKFSNALPARFNAVVSASRWILVVHFHHLVFDLRSVEILLHEFVTVYTSERQGVVPTLEDVPAYSELIAAFIAGTGNEGIDHWRAITTRPLPGAIDFMLPDRHRRYTSKLIEFEHRYRIPGSTSLVELAEGLGTTPFRMLSALGIIALASYFCTEEIVVGAPASVRPRGIGEKTIGNFVNTILFRFAPSPEESVLEVISRASGVIADAVQFRGLPYENMVRDYRQRHEHCPDPLFQAYFTVAPKDTLRVQSEVIDEFTYFRHRRGGNKFPLVIDFFYDLDSVEVISKTDGSLSKLDLEAIGELIGALISMTGDWSSLTFDEFKGRAAEKGVARRSNKHRQVFGTVSCPSIFEQIRQHSVVNPRAVAICSSDRVVRFNDLIATAEDLVKRIGAANIVPVIASDSAVYAFALLAALRSGKIFCPLDPTWPTSRLSACLRALQATDVVVDEITEQTVEALGYRLLMLGVLDRASEGAMSDLDPASPGSIPAGTADFDSVCYIYFTSGTTGTPKGAANTQRGLLNRLNWMSSEFGAQTAKVCLQTTKPWFDSFLWQVLWPLSHGGTVVCTPSAGHLGLPDLQCLIDQYSVTVTDFTPTLFNAFVEEVVARASTSGGSLLLVIVGGDTPSREHLKLFKKHMANARLINLYGPTECAIGSVYYEIGADLVDPIPIGNPIPRTKAIVVDPDGVPCHNGAVGEIALGGSCVGLGYINNLVASTRAFVELPLAPGSNTWYLTGDVGYVNSNGHLVLKGRIDDQIKARGFRIEPTDIEFTLRSVPGVRDVGVVFERTPSMPDGGIAAFVACAPEQSATTVDSCKRIAATALVPYMRPQIYIPLQALPKTAAGKLDRRELRKLVASYSIAPEARRSWDGALETEIASSIREALRFSPEPHDDLFELGVSSIQLIRLHALLERRYERRLPISQIWSNPTVEGFAAAIRSAEVNSGTSANVR